MDMVIIIGVIAGIAAILSFVYIVLIGQQPIIEWWRHFRGSKPVVPAPSSPVSPIPAVENEQAIVSRKSHTSLCQEYIERQGDSAIRKLLQPIIDEGRITDPAVPLPCDSDFVDCICSVVTLKAIINSIGNARENSIVISIK